jgi:hypothetical protein
MSDHVLADGSGAVECPRDSGRRCRLCELLDPGHPDHIPAFLALYLRDGESPPPPTSPRPRPVPALPDIPLAGDVVEAIARRIGADRLAAWWEKQTGKPCGCAERKEKLNRATGRLLRWAGAR